MAESRRQAAFIRQLLSARGTPYVWGGTSLRSGVDCSGLVYTAARNAGIRNVPRTSQEQFNVGTPVGIHQLRPGDLVFSHWGSEQGAGHVSIYVGNGKIIEAASAGHPVSVKSISVLDGHILGARRLLPGAGVGGPNHVENSSAFARQQINYYQQNRGQNVAAAQAALSNVHPIQVGQSAPLETPQQALARLQPTQQTLAGQSAFPSALSPPSVSGSGLQSLHDRLIKAV